jgi:hypothetical protein
MTASSSCRLKQSKTSQGRILHHHRRVAEEVLKDDPDMISVFIHAAKKTGFAGLWKRNS